jgi:sulfite exporter TauE/SafE
MLASITPLGQRARGFRFWPTATAYILASTLAGASVGALLGALGSPVADRLTVTGRLTVLGIVAVLGLALDLRWFGLQLPTVRRQVNEDWMTRYRGPVFGAGFGFQLGLGVVTIVTTSLIYLTLVAGLMAGGAAEGMLIGVVFGLARALPILAVSGVRDQASLRGVHASLVRWHGPVKRAAFGVQSVFAVTVGLAMLR